MEMKMHPNGTHVTVTELIHVFQIQDKKITSSQQMRLCA